MFIHAGRSRKGDARSSAAARSGSDYTPENGESVWGAEAQNGDVVEYPLSDAIKDQHQDDRLRGINFVTLLCGSCNSRPQFMYRYHRLLGKLVNVLKILLTWYRCHV